MKTKKNYCQPMAYEEGFVANHYCEICADKSYTIETDPEWINANVHYKVDVNANGKYEEDIDNGQFYNINPQSKSITLNESDFAELKAHPILWWLTEPYTAEKAEPGYYFSANHNYQGGGQQKYCFSKEAVIHVTVNRS